VIDHVRTATHHLLVTVDTLDLHAPSSLPGWSRAHVVDTDGVANVPRLFSFA
jgi:hypothetical protein